jgi:hypothetical protein
MKKIFNLMLLILLVSSKMTDILGQKLEWEYPVKPKTEAWAKLKNSQERLDACQMDEKSMKSISTKGLVYVCMQHPFFRSYVINDSPIEGFMNIMKKFNGYGELLNRKDALTTLLLVMKNEDYNQLESMKDSSAIGGKTLTWLGLEMMMCQDKLIDKLSKDEKNMFLKQLASRYDEKIKYNPYFGGMNHRVTAFLSRKFMKSLGEKTESETKEKQKKFDSFDTRMITDDGTVIKEMIAQFKNYTKNLK